MILVGPINLVYRGSMTEPIKLKLLIHINSHVRLSKSILGAKIQWRDHGKSRLKAVSLTLICMLSR